MKWIKIERDKYGFANADSINKMIDNLPIVIAEQFNEMQRKAHELKQAVTKLNSKIYEIPEVDAACNSADYLADVFLLIVDRCGQDENKMQQIRAMIFNQFKSQLGIYEYKL